MTLRDRTKLIDDLIKENRDATIKDYLDITEEVMHIQQAPAVKIALIKKNHKHRNAGAMIRRDKFNAI